MSFPAEPLAISPVFENVEFLKHFLSEVLTRLDTTEKELTMFQVHSLGTPFPNMPTWAEEYRELLRAGMPNAADATTTTS